MRGLTSLLSPTPKARRPRGIVDTSVLIAGIAAFKPGQQAKTSSGLLLEQWINNATFTWLLSDDIVDEYREIMTRLRVRPAVIGRVLNLLTEEGEHVQRIADTAISPDPDDEPFCSCAESGEADFIVTLNPRDYPQSKLTARVIVPGDRLPGERAQRRGKPRAKKR